MDTKKISFGFSKVKKKAAIVPRQEEEKEKVEYITSFDGKNIPLPEEKEKLIIPTKNNCSIAERKKATKRKVAVQIENENSLNSDHQHISLEQLAIQELTSNKSEQTTSNLVVPMSDTALDVSDIDPDYNDVPVSEFGYAMFRGMGWTPGAGIGKKQKVVEVRTTELRARRLGLGADVPSKKETSN